MKVSKIPGLGRFGVFIDDLDFNSITDEEWMEIGKLHLDSLVTVIRNTNITPKEYERRIHQWGTSRYLAQYHVTQKYGNLESSQVELDDEIKTWAKAVDAVRATEVDPDTRMLRVSGRKDKDGNLTGMFAEGELLWHSNESGNLCFAPGVALLGAEGVKGSSTGFLTTTDWYEEQSNSFRSELDEMIVHHTFTPGKINPGLRKEQDLIMYKNMCPEDTTLPLVCMSPGGIKGLHYSINTVHSIKGMTADESQAVFDQINKTLFVDKYIYDHWYQQDNDLMLFDNSITLHRRLGDIKNRLCYRIQYDFEKLTQNTDRYLIEPYASQYKLQLAEVNTVLGIQ